MTQASQLSGLEQFGIWAGVVAGVGSLAVSLVTSLRQLQLERRSRPVIESFEWTNRAEAPPMPDEVRGYGKTGEAVDGVLRVYGHGQGSVIPNLWVSGAGSPVLLVRTIRWSAVGNQLLAVGSHPYVGREFPLPGHPPADATVAAAGLWKGNSGAQPVFWSAEENPDHLIDVAYSVQEWRPKA